MAASESKQRYLGRNRPPRVQITYDVEIGNAFETKELPLVVGILADLSGKVTPSESMDKRGFVDIDRDNFDTVLRQIKPNLDFKVRSLLGGGAENLKVSLEFSAFDDFSPENIVDKVPVLKDLFDRRQKLQDLLIKLDGNEVLDQSLRDSLATKEQRESFQKLLTDAGTPAPAALPAPAPAAEKKADSVVADVGDTKADPAAPADGDDVTKS
jgi:type VI secretion system protein ImpB